MASSVLSSAAVATRSNVAQANMVAPFTGLKSAASFPVSRKQNLDITSIASNGGRVQCAPPRLICDSRVLERYLLEAKEAENITTGCAEHCSLNENITVPDTKVNFYAWKRMEVGQQAVEVWQGLALLSEAVLRGQALLVNSSQPWEPLQLHVDKAVSGLRSLTTLLRALRAQKEAISPPDAASAAPLRTITADTFRKLFRVYSNFLRGKLKLYTGEACRTGDRGAWSHPQFEK
nr:chEPO [synthetic construct]